MKRLTALSGAVLAITILLGPTPHAATPPGLVNYQGVLRDAADNPLDGGHDMVFRFFTAETGGDEILIDRHTVADSEAVTVVGGLFSVRLGSGAIYDGSGPGTYASLAEVFRDHAEAWLRVEVDGEVLDPRVQVVAAAYALNATNLDGRPAAGFINTTDTAQTKAGRLKIDNVTSGQYGLEVYAPEGAYFHDSDQSGQAWIANGNWGVGGKGNVAGGSFEDADDSGYAHVGVGDHGIQAYGNVAGGSFDDLDNTSTAQVAFNGFGVYAQGDDAGGYFDDLTQSGYAFVANGDYGIQAYGNIAGGTFENPAGGSFAHAGRENYGLRAYGNLAGGTFDDLDGTGQAYVGFGDRGIEATGSEMGGYFEGDFAAGEFREGDSPAYVYIATGHHGIKAYGASVLGTGGAGVWAVDQLTGTYGELAFTGASTAGNAAKMFVQNHPLDSDRVITYISLEGDEAGTYTRGTARLSNGKATVPLGETYKWVTNPDIGLTAHVTPRGELVPVAVLSVSTEKLVVIGPAGSDAAFDYVVHGLRIGFEQSSVVREKTVESFIPSMDGQRARYERSPELRRFNALERFKNMAVNVDGVDAVDLSRAAELAAAIQEYDPEIHGPVDQLRGHEPPRRDGAFGKDSPSEVDEIGPAHVEPALDDRSRVRPAIAGVPIAGAIDGQVLPEKSAAGVLRGELLPIGEPVEIGQVIALDPEHPGKVRAAATMADPTVIGIAVAVTEDALEVRVVAYGFEECKVDAGYGAIRAGDLITSSPTKGHAMYAVDAPPGTILGKALESLEVGTGTIKILVMPR